MDEGNVIALCFCFCSPCAHSRLAPTSFWLQRLLKLWWWGILKTGGLKAEGIDQGRAVSPALALLLRLQDFLKELRADEVVSFWPFLCIRHSRWLSKKTKAGTWALWEGGRCTAIAVLKGITNAFAALCKTVAFHFPSACPWGGGQKGEHAKENRSALLSPFPCSH